MKIYKGKAFEDVYKNILIDLFKDGEENAPRGMKTIEFKEPVSIVIEDMRKYIIPSAARKPLLAFWEAEFLWMLKGSNELEHIANYLPMWRMFTDDDKTLNGAYGHRLINWEGRKNIVNQFEEVYKKLKNDINSRQAVMVMYNPEKDFKPTKDVPCNNLIQFYVRDKKLCTTIYARSQDIINGTFYDIGVLSHFAQLIAGRLGLEVGSHTHICNSLHIYERDFDKAKAVIEENHPKLYENISPSDYRISNDIYDEQIKLILHIEEVSRISKNFISKAEINELLSRVKNEDWKSVCALIVITNLRKAGRKEDAFEFYCLVKNEYKDLIAQRWN